jgi:hypothetical protein
VTESQRESVPRDDGSELETALAFLRFARHCVLKKTDGLNDDQLRQSLVPSGTTLLGLVEHLTGVERYWFGYHVAGGPAESDDTSGSQPQAESDTAEILDAYRTAAIASDTILTAIGHLDSLVSEPIDDEYLHVRWVVAHMTSETARHAGHADILREQIDGVTGR